MLLTDIEEARKLAKAREQPNLPFVLFSVTDTLAQIRAAHFPELLGTVTIHFVHRGPLACICHEEADAAIYMHQLLNHGETPLEVVSLICKHELLHLRIHPVEKHGVLVQHPPEFWEAEKAICPERNLAWSWIWVNLGSCLKQRRRLERIDVLPAWKKLWGEGRTDAATCQKLWRHGNPLLRDYRKILEEMIGNHTKDHDPDAEHPKVQATVHRALEFFKRGQKSLVFCVYTKTAEAIRDQLQAAIDAYLGEIREGVCGNASAFENFRRRFFNRREPLFSLIQDHPLLGDLRGGRVGVIQKVALTEEHLRQVATLLVAQGENAESDIPDRRLLIAATEHVAVKWWRDHSEGVKWLGEVLRSCPELEERMVDPRWLEGREPLSRSERAGRV